MAPQTVAEQPASAAGDASRRARPAPGPVNMEDFKNDPLIQRALEMFKGQIVGARS
jgi:hypothetical protein